MAGAATAGEREICIIDIVNPIEIEAERLLEIDNDPKLKRVLKEWEKLFKVESLRVEKITARAIVVKNELYQLIGFYSVFQGVILTAVSQTNLIQCNQSWGPALLSVLASIATLGGVCNKLNSYNRVKRTLEKATNELQTPNGEYMRRPNLLPNPNATVETTERNPQLKSIEGEPDYLIESDPNQTYSIWSMWYGKEVVLSLNSDELIDNAVITIGWDTEKKMFTKHYEQRYVILKIAEH
ncbi:unnamed protein product [Sphagnum compactum]